MGGKIHPWLWLLPVVACIIKVRCEDVTNDELWDGFRSEKGSVIELDENNFERAINTFDRILVDFYAPWCGHCKRLAPELDAAAPVLAKLNRPVVLAKLNADKFTKLASKYDVSAYPTLKLFIDGFPTDYYGPRRAESLVLHLKKLSAPDLAFLKSPDEIHEYIKEAGKSFPIFIGFGMQEPMLADLARVYKKRAWFAISDYVDDDILSEYDFDKTPALLAMRPEFSEQDVFYGPFEGNFLQPFIHQSLLPLCIPIRYEALNLLKDDKRPIVLTIVKDEREEASLRLVKTLKAAASANRDLVFAYVGMNQWGEFADTFNIAKDTELPMIILWNGDLDYYTVEGLESLTEGNFEAEIPQFIKAYRLGKVIKKTVKGPSFRGFLQSLMTIRTVYILAFVCGILALLLLLTGPDSKEDSTGNVRDVRHAEQSLLQSESDNSAENREVHNKEE
eukprot:TRINITY_DN5040_c0_g1_i1.p1 TRINITY_DN5040_c0_g1~~TRINITY_DN5040_c0_g1_i1.p1  ORF type:complete len:449 (+),score=90.38 TRINITY_DN5040_c0_g1_i1:126-1472(+)